MHRISNLLSALVGAAVVGLVVVVLALNGAFDRTERVVAPAPQGTSTLTQSTAADAGVSDIYSAASPAVAFIQTGRGTGSGFLIDTRGHLVTNQHVVESGSNYQVRFGAEGEAIDAELVGEDASTDLAVLRVNPEEVPDETRPLPLASSSELDPGDVAIAIGSPFGLSGTITTGVVSALDREIPSPNGFEIPGAIQTDAAINPGNSGGPLLDTQGRVIGVNSQIRTGASQQNSGVGFAVAVDTVKEVVPELISDGEIDRAYLGVQTIEEPGERGAVIAEVTAGGPAAEGGLRPGDRILRMGDREVPNPSSLATAVLGFEPGDRVTVTVERDGEETTIDVVLGERPDQVTG